MKKLNLSTLYHFHSMIKKSNHAIFAAVITSFVLSFFLPVRLQFISCFLFLITYILRVFEYYLKIPYSIH